MPTPIVALVVSIHYFLFSIIVDNKFVDSFYVASYKHPTRKSSFIRELSPSLIKERLITTRLSSSDEENTLDRSKIKVAVIGSGAVGCYYGKNKITSLTKHTFNKIQRWQTLRKRSRCKIPNAQRSPKSMPNIRTGNNIHPWRHIHPIL